MVSKQTVFFGVSVVLLAAVSVVITLFLGASTTAFNEPMTLFSALRTAPLRGFSGNVALGNITIGETEEGNYQVHITGLSSAPCLDLTLHLTSTTRPTSTESSIRQMSISEYHKQQDAIIFQLSSTFEASESNGMVLYCTSTSTVLGAGTFSMLAPSLGTGIVSFGTFYGLGDYNVAGKITVLRRNVFVDMVPIIQYSLRFENIVADEGPDLYLYLMKSAVMEDVQGEGTRVELDGIQFFAKTGSFQQDLPIGLEATAFKGAYVWCDMYSVTFGKARLRTLSESALRTFDKDTVTTIV